MEGWISLLIEFYRVFSARRADFVVGVVDLRGENGLACAEMPKIEILPDVLASQVAAGEVVERPASVVKEMVENSIDAGAKHVEVEIQKGGATLIKITDDGCGMSKEDALMSLERHATSKLKNSAQLAAITTMGFRGEAVPSVASVSKMRIATQETDAVEGSEIIIDGGVIKEVRVTGIQSGTVFEIKSLFFNMPARRKFMRTESTESAHVEYQLKLHALAYPEVRFTFRKDGRMVFDVPATSDRRTRISGLSGNDVGRSLLEVPYTEQSGMEVLGYVMPSEFARKGRKQQFVFLNGRPVEDAAISRAIKDGFKGALIEGMNPTAWLWISMNPALVDVNVHPAKKEVRFHKPYDVRNLVLTAVENRVMGIPQQVARGEAKIISRKSGEVMPVRKAFSSPESTTVEPSVAEKSQPAPGIRAESPQPVAEQEEIEAVIVESPRFKILGQLHQIYVLMEGEDGLVLLEPKAARERIVYEQVIEAAENGSVDVQGLLVPEVLDLDSRDLDMVLSNVENFAEAGITVEPFGGNSIQVSSLPALLKLENPREFITKVIDELVETQGSRRGRLMAFEVFAENVAGRAARYQRCDLSQMNRLLDEMFACDLPYCTPDGRPTLIQISMNELEKKFKS